MQVGDGARGNSFDELIGSSGLTINVGGGGDDDKDQGIWFEGEKDGKSAWERALEHAEQSGRYIWNIDIIAKDGRITWKTKDVPKPADRTWITKQDPNTKNWYMYDSKGGPDSIVILSYGATTNPAGKPGSREIPDSVITHEDGSKTRFYEVTDTAGKVTRQSFTEDAPAETISEADIINLGEGLGKLIPTGKGTYTHMADPGDPFVTSASDVIPLPNQNGSLIKTSENQYQFVRDTYDPGVKTDPQTGRQFVQSASGNWTELDARYQQGVVESGGREFLQQTTGALAELEPRYTPEVTEVDGMSLLQQRSGDISQLAKPDLNQIITQALVDGEYDKAFAFQDFRDRPTAQETFQTALQFARSPADQILISSIARGEQTVQPPPAGTIQRVGPQADFLVQAYQDFQRRTQAGRAPTEEEATTLSARAAAGASPLTDTLQARLESMTRDMERKDEEHAVKMQGLIQKQSEEAQLFQTKLNTALGLNADGTPKVSADPITSTSTSTSTPASDTSTSTVSDTVSTDALTDTNVETESDFQRLSGKSYLTPAEAAAAHASFMETRIPNPLLSPAQQEFFDAQNIDTTGMSPATLNFQMAVGRGDPASPIYRDNRQATNVPFAASEQERIGTETRAAIDAQLDITGRGLGTETMEDNLGHDFIGGGPPMPSINLSPALTSENSPGNPMPASLAGYAPGTTFRDIENALGLKPRAGGGTVQPGEITVVGEQGPEIAMMPPGTHILPLGRATKQDIKAAQSTGRAYQTGGIVFGELPFGLRQLQAGRPITPSRGYLSQAAGLTLPSAQALSNLTPESRDVYFDLAQQAGIPSRAFGQELQTTMPAGRRLPTSSMLPLGRRGVR